MAEYKFDSSYSLASVLLWPVFCLYSPFWSFLRLYRHVFFPSKQVFLAISLQLSLPWCFVFQSLLVTFWIRLGQHHLEQRARGENGVALRTIYLPVQTRNIKYHQMISNDIKWAQTTLASPSFVRYFMPALCWLQLGRKSQIVVWGVSRYQYVGCVHGHSSAGQQAKMIQIQYNPPQPSKISFNLLRSTRRNESN